MNLKAYALTDSIGAPEANVALSLIQYTASSPAASMLLSSFSQGTVIQLDITTAFKAQNFYGIALASDDGFEGTFSSREGTSPPIITTQYDESTLGSKFYTGVGAPANTLGNNGDIYINTNTGDLYNKVSGGWVASLNLKGPPGSAASNLLRGAGAPTAGLALVAICISIFPMGIYGVIPMVPGRLRRTCKARPECRRNF